MLRRCLASLHEGLKKRRNKGGGRSDSDGDAADKGDNGGDDETVSETVSDEDICAWCWESEDKKLFLCDGEGCGRYARPRARVSVFFQGCV
ncbi:unnamed protein product [Ectocarpus sp. CCAP 1310/34]|nr:unnamed protein product [Ectocarpus sp. CCAP 1310/34]